MRKRSPTQRSATRVSATTDRKGVVRRQARDVLGGEKAARIWLNTPAMALDQKRPIDLLSSARGLVLVEQLLRQIEYGVYI